MELERRCPFFLAGKIDYFELLLIARNLTDIHTFSGWPDITVRPSAMRMHAARQVLEMETITIEACKGCERCGTGQ